MAVSRVASKCGSKNGKILAWLLIIHETRRRITRRRR
jgi:hypothetical protein